MALVSTRYARALVGAAAEDGQDPAEVQALLGEYAAMVSHSRELREAMESPAVHMDEKLAVLDGVLGKLGAKSKDKHRLVRNFLAVLAEHGRMGLLNEVMSEYRRLEDEREGVAEAEITSAQPLNEADRKLLEEQIGKMAGRQVRAQYADDAHLMGGVVVRMGSTVYDGSILGRLERLKQELLRS